jgi:hypothetical protein
MAGVGLAAAGSIDAIALDTGGRRRANAPAGRIGPSNRPAPTVDAAIFQAAHLVAAGAHTEAARILDEALAGAPAGNAGWLVPIEPLLNVTAHPDSWARVLARLRNRAT